MTRLLDDFLAVRLIPEGRNDWMEKVLLTRLWITADSQQDDALVFDSAKEILGYYNVNVDKPLSAAATHAAQMASDSMNIQRGRS